MLNLFIPVFYASIQLFFITALGFVLRKYGSWSESFFKELSKLIVKIALPVYLFSRIIKSDRQDLLSSGIFPLLAILIPTLSILISIGILYFVKLKLTDKKAAIALSSFGNSGYIPLSLIEILPVSLVIFDKFINSNIAFLYVGAYLIIASPILWTVAYFLITGKNNKPKLKDFFPPPLFGVLGAFLVVFFNLNDYLFNQELIFFHITKALERFGNTTMPLVLICLGAMIANLQKKKASKTTIKICTIALFNRFLVIPSLFFSIYIFLLKPLNLSLTQCWVIFLETNIPPATNLSVMATQAETNEDHTAYTLLVSYIIYPIILPFYIMFFFYLSGIKY